MEKPFLTRWIRQRTLWLGAVFTISGIAVMMIGQPSVEWIMSHSVEQFLQRMQMLFLIFVVFAVPGLILWCYSLYMTWKPAKD